MVDEKDESTGMVGRIVYMPRQMADQIDAWAREDDRSTSGFIKRALEEFFTFEKKD